MSTYTPRAVICRGVFSLDAVYPYTYNQPIEQRTERAMTEIEKPRIDPDAVRPGSYVQRRPYGRFCTIEKINEDRSKVLVRDGSTSVWMSMATLVKNWA